MAAGIRVREIQEQQETQARPLSARYTRRLFPPAFSPSSSSERGNTSSSSEKPGTYIRDLFHEVGETPFLSCVHQVADEGEFGRHRLVKTEGE